MNGFQQRIKPAIMAVPDQSLRAALLGSIDRHAATLAAITATFNRFAGRDWPLDVRRTFLRSWHDTHLKMLPIYGLTCRLNKLAEAAEGETRAAFFRAAARNAATSHEDLNLEWQFPATHTQLFDQLANTICDGDAWRLDRHCIDQAAAFKRWIYMSMVADPITTGLYTNMFSEIFNHGEYGEAMEPFEAFLENYCGCTREESRRLGIYIRCHVDDGVEEAHFRCVVDALDAYAAATGKTIDHSASAQVFDTYLSKIGEVMTGLDQVLDEAA